MTPRVPKAKLTGLAGSLIKRFSSKMFGKVPESIGVIWNNPDVFKAGMSFGRKIQKWDQVDESLKSFAHMAVAAQVGCSWCLDFNYFQAWNKKLDLRKASQVPRWRESDVFTALERDVMAYAEAMTNTPPTVTDELSARLLDQLGAAALVELNAVIGFANYTTRCNTALGIESEGYSAACEIPLSARPERSGVASTS
ncbi:carboxymuconolactone decarboxylase family protein [Haloechinothrix halophila]|uniref:carboxymuconolactone decarboxylase family protein n=1 Tax=Haloechinothrix halophila TaxID=1069073 RepID=UPI0004095743|nr:carboxymuconolactone decarboxylase family protein [Haloechinothrix halophila]